MTRCAGATSTSTGSAATRPHFVNRHHGQQRRDRRLSHHAAKAHCGTGRLVAPYEYRPPPASLDSHLPTICLTTCRLRFLVDIPPQCRRFRKFDKNHVRPIPKYIAPTGDRPSKHRPIN